MSHRSRAGCVSPADSYPVHVPPPPLRSRRALFTNCTHEMNPERSSHFNLQRFFTPQPVWLFSFQTQTRFYVLLSKAVVNIRPGHVGGKTSGELCEAGVEPQTRSGLVNGDRMHAQGGRMGKKIGGEEEARRKGGRKEGGRE